MKKEIRLDVFGKKILAIRSDGGWSLFYLSGDGKRHLADDIVIPSFVDESLVENYLADICHEWATSKHPDVKRLG